MTTVKYKISEGSIPSLSDRESFYDEEFENYGAKNLFVREPSKK